MATRLIAAGADHQPGGDQRIGGLEGAGERQIDLVNGIAGADL